MACEKEKFYDEEIAPALKALGEKCVAQGLSLCALVEWGPFAGGVTSYLHENRSAAVDLVRAAAMSNGNVDTLITALVRTYGKNPGESAWLRVIESILEERGGRP
jgi:hypothetical protein